MLPDEIRGVVEECKFPDYRFDVVVVDGATYIRAVYYETDTVTGNKERQQTRHWIVPTCANRSEVVATCFKCVVTSMEHKTREWFTYRNKPIYHPHHDVDALLSICEERR